jgi:hypothetical protein
VRSAARPRSSRTSRQTSTPPSGSWNRLDPTPGIRAGLERGGHCGRGLVRAHRSGHAGAALPKPEGDSRDGVACGRGDRQLSAWIHDGTDRGLLPPSRAHFESCHLRCQVSSVACSFTFRLMNHALLGGGAHAPLDLRSQIAQGIRGRFDAVNSVEWNRSCCSRIVCNNNLPHFQALPVADLLPSAR